MDNLEMTENAAAQHYEAKVGGDVKAFIEYRPTADALMLTHTEVEADMEGRGVGSALVKYALEDIQSRGLKLVPMCPFVAAYIQRHREYADLVKPEHRAMYGL
jgi:uncharacterized protein